MGTCREIWSIWPGSRTPVVQDQAVALARDREDPAARVVVGDVHRAQQQVEAAALRRPLDAPVEHVVELQRLGLVGERVVAEQPGGVPRAAAPAGSTGGGIGEPADSGRRIDHADDFLQPDRQRAGGAVGYVAEFGDRPLHPVPDLGARVAAAVEHARHRGDGDARRPAPRHRSWARPARPQRTSHSPPASRPPAATGQGKRFPARRARPGESPVSAYRPDVEASVRRRGRPPQGRVPATLQQCDAALVAAR